MGNTASGGSLITVLVTFFLVGIPLALVNASIAKRKGKSGVLYGWLSLIPVLGYLLAIYLISLPDKELLDRVTQILDILQRPPHVSSGAINAKHGR